MDNAPAIGFIGFGEAGFHLAKGLRGGGIASLAAFDIHTNTPGPSEIIKARAAESGTRLVGSNRELAEVSDIVLCVVTANQAADAAAQTSPHLTSRHFYAEMNSISPALKRSIANVIDATGARFVEIAIMAPVPPYGHKTPMLAGGEAAAEFSERLAPFGMQIEVGDKEIGAAAATKMCRSIVVKGMEALLTECVLGLPDTEPPNASSLHWPRPSPASTGTSSPATWWDALSCTENAGRGRWKRWLKLFIPSGSSRSWPKLRPAAWTGAPAWG